MASKKRIRASCIQYGGYGGKITAAESLSLATVIEAS
jgi:hypothetical protein